MHALAIAGGITLLLIVLWDAFETIIRPRRVRRHVRLARGFYQITWWPWRALGRRLMAGNTRDNILSVFGPLSLLLLLTTWAALLIVGFALVHCGFGSRLQVPPGLQGFRADLYFSGTTLFTLGLGDVTAQSTAGRVVTVTEGGTGFAFLALIIGYLPILSQAFSRREANITLLDARAGSPPSAVELLKRHAGAEGNAALRQLLGTWERWSAELLETHISFPVLAYYRSQHDNQSWVAALTTILDVCALLMAVVDAGCERSARMTFAIARHAAVDLCNIFRRPPTPPTPDRLRGTDLARVRELLESLGMRVASESEVGEKLEQKLERLRRMYEPYMNALGLFLVMPLPAWLPPERPTDNWQAMR